VVRTYKITFNLHITSGADPEFGKGGCTLLKRLKAKKKRRSRVGEGSSNITMKLKHISIPIYSFTENCTS